MSSYEQRRRHLREVQLNSINLERLKSFASPDAWNELNTFFNDSKQNLEDRVIWNINSTPQGGGVAEMLTSLLPYVRGSGIDIRWLVMFGDPKFFSVTKRLHHYLHGSPGDGGSLGSEEASIYESTMQANRDELRSMIRSGDIIILHDPQTVGLIPFFKELGNLVLWRCHIGSEEENIYCKKAWKFLSSYLGGADGFVFSRKTYVPSMLQKKNIAIIAPSIDPLSPKNQELDKDTVDAILSHVGILQSRSVPSKVPLFTRFDGTPGRVDHICDVMSTGPVPCCEDPLIVQISRWDHLKDHVGLMRAFTNHVISKFNAYLILAGPTVHSVADDPEAAQTLDKVERIWRGLTQHQRSHVQLICLPMSDLQENAAIVNALQRKATIVVQKSLEEGFGLTVTEAMWKKKAVIASAVGGIKEQIMDKETGILINPRDEKDVGEAILDLLKDSKKRTRLGNNAHNHVQKNFLHDRHILQFARFLRTILE